jgi:hypothetical protein
MISQHCMLLTVSGKIDLRTMKRKRSKRKAVREDPPMLLSRRESQVVERSEPAEREHCSSR